MDTITHKDRDRPNHKEQAMIEETQSPSKNAVRSGSGHGNAFWDRTITHKDRDLLAIPSAWLEATSEGRSILTVRDPRHAARIARARLPGAIGIVLDSSGDRAEVFGAGWSILFRRRGSHGA